MIVTSGWLACTLTPLLLKRVPEKWKVRELREGYWNKCPLLWFKGGHWRGIWGEIIYSKSEGVRYELGREENTKACSCVLHFSHHEHAECVDTYHSIDSKTALSSSYKYIHQNRYCDSREVLLPNADSVAWLLCKTANLRGLIKGLRESPKHTISPWINFCFQEIWRYRPVF